MFKVNGRSRLIVRASAPLLGALAAFIGFSSAAVAQSGSGVTLEEIVVSARRVEENIQDTPVSVTALTSEAIELRNIQSVAEITNFAPNIQFDGAASESGGGSSSQISIRGIGQTDYAITVDPGVGLYLDGVYIGKSAGSLSDAIDLESIEVLRGPQGTLFGRNTIGGAVILTSKKPSDELGATIDATVGEYDRRDLKASVNIPVSDVFRVRASAATLNRDGHVDRVQDGGTQGDKDAVFGRIVAEWDISENIQGTFTSDITTTREESPGQITLDINEAAFFNQYNITAQPQCDPALADPARFTDPLCANSQYERTLDSLETNNTGPNQSDTDVWGVSATFDWDLGDASVKSITAYRRAEVLVAQELTGTPGYRNDIGQDIDLKQFSQEFQISGRALDDRLSYIGGLYYATEEGEQVFPVLLDVVQFISGGEIDNDSTAVFGQLGYDITDALSVTLGARYSRETKRFLPRQRIINVPDIYQPFFDGFAAATTDPVSGLVGFLVQEDLLLFPEVEVEEDFNEFTPSLTFDYRFNDEVLGYASYSQGFKGGGFPLRGFPPLIPGVTTPLTEQSDLLPSYEPETAEVFEIGLKSQLWDNRLRLNMAAFTTAYEDVQLTANSGPSAFVPVLINAGDVDIHGFELEAELAASNALRLNLGLGFLDSEYDSLSPDAIAAGTTLASDIPNAPEVTGNFGASLDLMDNDSGHLFLRTDVSYRDSQFKTVDNAPALEQKAYTLYNASITYRAADGNWQASLGGTNLTDELYIVSGVANGALGYAQAVVSRPREWFLSFKYSM